MGRHSSQQGKGIMRTVVDFIAMVAIVAVCAFLLRTFVISPFCIPSGSMETTIMPGDMVFSEKISTRDGVDAGEIITFADPELPSRTLIKRCIATEGQTINLVDGVVYVDDQPLSEPYALGSSYPLQTATGLIIEYPYTIPEGSLWVMGDNRSNSLDSRYFGAIPEDSVDGHAFAVYWPLTRLGVL